METTDIARGLNGMALIGGFVNDPEKNISAIPFVLAGDMDDELYRGFYLARYGTQAAFNAHDIDTAAMVGRLKNMLRQFVRGIFDAAERDLIRQQQLKHSQVLADLKKTSQPHEQGTVAEIAARYGISKSEVRRRRADGTLNELIAKHLT